MTGLYRGLDTRHGGSLASPQPNNHVPCSELVNATRSQVRSTTNTDDFTRDPGAPRDRLGLGVSFPSTSRSSATPGVPENVRTRGLLSPIYPSRGLGSRPPRRATLVRPTRRTGPGTRHTYSTLGTFGDTPPSPVNRTSSDSLTSVPLYSSLNTLPSTHIRSPIHRSTRLLLKSFPKILGYSHHSRQDQGSTTHLDTPQRLPLVQGGPVPNPPARGLPSSVRTGKGGGDTGRSTVRPGPRTRRGHPLHLR